MQLPLEARTIIMLVTATALFGMMLGGLFGWAAGELSPGLFQPFAGQVDFGATRAAIVLGSFGGVVCGGALGAFATAAQAFGMWLHRDEKRDE